ncbi:MAG TPA: peptide ABC transporter substrate-binding protein [Dehalococcoidia bacterium]
MQTRWPFFGAFVAGIAIIAALWYLVLSNPKGEAVPASGGRYIEGVVGAPERINPLYAAANPVDRDLSSLIFSGLVRLGPDGTPEPDLAYSWEITGNGQSYIFHLREGVAWQDDENSRFDADDVVFTYRALSDPAFKGDPALAGLMQGVVVSARDPYTVEFKLEQAYAPFLSYLTIGILPQHLLKDLDADGLYSDEFNARPVGTGPYRLHRRADDRIELETNPTYYLGPPRVSTLEFRYFTDEDDLTGALRSAAIDGALLPPTTPMSEIAFLRETGRFSMRDLTGTSMNLVYLDTRSPLFADADLRHALQQAVNVQSLITDVSGGRGATADTGIPRSSWAYTPVESPAFDPGSAASTLERLGWSRGRDGIRQKDGLKLSFSLATSDDPQRVAIAEDVSRQWRAVGVDAVIEPVGANTYIDERLLARDFDAALAEIDPGADPDPYPFWHSSQIAAPGRNLSSYSDPRVDDVLERARQTTDTARRRELYELFEGYIIAGAPVLPLYAPVWTYVQATEVQGFTPSLLFTPSARFANVNEWYIKTRVR